MKTFIIVSFILIIACLIAEKYSAVRHRRALKAVVHVNGTRGKSAVTRLIAAGLCEGGVRVLCKTTGTVPQYIDPDGSVHEIKRRGGANIREQIWILKKAYELKAEVLVTECMAVDPELQFVSEHRILKSDIGVITNARVDHVAEMGSDEKSVAEALSNTVPENGTVFTSDEKAYEIFKEAALKLNSEAFLILPEDYESNNLFPENEALAAAVCEKLGVDKDTSRRGMMKVIEDPYTSFEKELPGGAVFINAMSANDPYSTKEVYRRYTDGLEIEKNVFVLNCRTDRGYRTKLMIDYILSEKPHEVIVTGKGAKSAANVLKRHGIVPEIIQNTLDIPLDRYGKNTVIFAIGNVADGGIKLIEKVRKGDE